MMDAESYNHFLNMETEFKDQKLLKVLKNITFIWWQQSILII